jgi:hypothetical protein
MSPTSGNRRFTGVAIVAGSAVAAALIGFVIARALAPGTSTLRPGTHGTPVVTPTPTVALSKVCDVTSYGADPSGTRDSQAAIQQAIDACSAAPGGEVTIPVGTFALMDGQNLRVTGPNGPVINGAGAQSTFIVQHARRDIFDITADGTTVENLNLNTATYNPGVPPQLKNPVPGVLYSTANNVTLANITGEAGTGFGLRVTGPNPCDAYPRGGNTLQNITMTTTGTGGFAAVDIDCQNGTRASNITIHGGILALFRDENTTVTGENFTPGPYALACAPPWIITGPSTNVAVTNVVSHGGHGVVHGVTSAITTNAQQLLNSSC